MSLMSLWVEVLLSVVRGCYHWQWIEVVLNITKIVQGNFVPSVYPIVHHFQVYLLSLLPYFGYIRQILFASYCYLLFLHLRILFLDLRSYVIEQ